MTTDNDDVFNKVVVAHEIKMINAWRQRNGRALLPATETSAQITGAIGVALSGGGIRSASFGLGALQALDQNLAVVAQKATSKENQTQKPSGIACVDYLSTVSGGGYIGTSLRLGMEKLDGQFPFSSGSGDRSDNLAVGHIRNYSRYLIPRGLPDVISNVAVILRGFIANLAMILAVILILAGLTGWFNPNQASYGVPDFFGINGFPYPPIILSLGGFAYTKCLLIAGMLGFFIWGLLKSYTKALTSEFDGHGHCVAVGWIYITAICAFIEFQPFAIKGLFDVYGTGKADTQKADTWLGLFSTWIAAITPYAAPLAAIAAFVSRLFGDTLKNNDSQTGAVSIGKKVLAKLAIWFVALALPLTIWVFYLHASLATDIGYSQRPIWLQNAVSYLCGAPDIGLTDLGKAEFDPVTREKLKPSVSDACNAPAGGGKESKAFNAPNKQYLVSTIFVIVGLFLFLITLAYRPNANSLHRMYRDRLSKAFLFDPTGRKEVRNNQSASDPRIPQNGDVPFVYLQDKTGPVHLVNTAINLQGSQTLNRRGRNADFFFFSSGYFGSASTGYTLASDEKAQEFLPDIATAMAVSGAAASSNMGSNTISGMAPTLALLNIRLGYWMKNPRHILEGSKPSRIKATAGFYLVEEMMGSLDEESAEVYLTDGGHIENLGLYELLRRRCKTIVVIDAEADPNMTFGSFVTAQRYARLDLGIRIDLPWQEISEATQKTNEIYKAGKLPKKEEAANRPHCAVGTIDYGDGQTGTLIYFKSSLTGDENDYVANYKMRNANFPHETTADQFFSEEQFEAYRALGFHAVQGAFTGKGRIAALPPATNMLAKLETKSRKSGKNAAKTSPEPPAMISPRQVSLIDCFKA